MLKYNFQSKYHRRFDGAQGIRRPRRADHAPSHRLPHYIDLREWMTPIVNQGTLNIWWVLFQFHIFYFLWSILIVVVPLPLEAPVSI